MLFTARSLFLSSQTAFNSLTFVASSRRVSRRSAKFVSSRIEPIDEFVCSIRQGFCSTTCSSIVAKEAWSRSSAKGSGPKARIQPLNSSLVGSNVRNCLHFSNNDSIEVIADLMLLIPSSRESSSLTTVSLVRIVPNAGVV